MHGLEIASGDWGDLWVMRKIVIAAVLSCLATPPVIASEAPPPSKYNNEMSYPSEALRQGWEGTVEFTVTIGTNGTALDCVVTQSSGHDVLDKATCKTMLERARFIPPKDADGNPVEGKWSSKTVWKLPR